MKVNIYFLFSFRQNFLNKVSSSGQIKCFCSLEVFSQVFMVPETSAANKAGYSEEKSAAEQH